MKYMFVEQIYRYTAKEPTNQTAIKLNFFEELSIELSSDIVIRNIISQITC